MYKYTLYIHIYVYTNIWIHIFIYIWIHTLYSCIYICFFRFMYKYTLYIFIYMYIHINEFIYLYTYEFIHCIHAYMYVFSDLCINIYFFRFFSIIRYWKTLSIVPCAIQWMSEWQSLSRVWLLATPWPRNSPGKNTGVGCHFLPQCYTVGPSCLPILFIVLCTCCWSWSSSTLATWCKKMLKLGQN